MCAHVHMISVKVRPPSFTFLSRVSKHFIDFISRDSINVSATAIIRLVDNLRPRPCLASLRLFADLITKQNAYNLKP